MLIDARSSLADLQPAADNLLIVIFGGPSHEFGDVNIVKYSKCYTPFEGFGSVFSRWKAITMSNVTREMEI